MLLKPFLVKYFSGHFFQGSRMRCASLTLYMQTSRIYKSGSVFVCSMVYRSAGTVLAKLMLFHRSLKFISSARVNGLSL